MAGHQRNTCGLTVPCETLGEEAGRDPLDLEILLVLPAGVFSALTTSGMTLRLLLFLRDCRETEPLGSLTSSNWEMVVEPGDSGSIGTTSCRVPGFRIMSGADSIDSCLTRVGDVGETVRAISCGGGKRIVESFSACGIKVSGGIIVSRWWGGEGVLWTTVGRI